MTGRSALITGVAGQDGSLLADMLLAEGWRVVGVSRRKSVADGLDHLVGARRQAGFLLEVGDITDAGFVHRMAATHRPDRWFNLAAMSHVGQSFREPVATFEVNAASVVTQLDALRLHSAHTRFYQASTSELFGTTPCPETGFTEDSPFHPRSPYGVAKLAAYWAVVNAREAWGMHASNGILFNHSSVRRGPDFATRKITRTVAAIVAGDADAVRMGDLSAFRDEGHAEDHMAAARAMLDADTPGDWVVATGTGATIQQMLEHVCARVGLDARAVYTPDPALLRPSEVPRLLGDPTRARETLGWAPRRDWRDVLDEMLRFDLDQRGVGDTFRA